ncbi:polysaccharide biosynthesis tyrosine autokinase [Thermopirellula anaerolimosa]
MSESNVSAGSTAAVPAGTGSVAVLNSRPPFYIDAEWQSPEQQHAQGGGIGAYLHAFRRRWPAVIFLGLVTAAVCAGAAWFLVVPRYSATALIRVSAANQAVLFQSSGDSRNFDIYKSTQLEYLRSRFVLVSALRRPEVARLASIQNEPDPVQWVSERLSVRYPGNAELMQVSIATEKGDEAAALVNAIVDAYMEEVVEVEQNERRNRLGELDQLYVEKESEVRKLQNDLKQLSAQLETGDSQALTLKQQITLQQFSTYRSELVGVSLKIMRTQGEIALKNAIRDKAAQIQISESEIDAAGRVDPVMVQLQMRQAELKALTAQMRETVRPEFANRYEGRYSRELAEIDAKIQARREELKQELEKKRLATLDEDLESLKFELAILEQQQSQLQQEVEEVRKTAETFGKGSIEVEFLRAEVDLARKTLATIAEERNKLRIELRSKPRITLVQRAEAPRISDQDRRLQLSVLGGLGGFCLPGFAILWWDTRRKTVNTSAEVAQDAGVDVLGTVPLLPRRATRALSSDSKRHRHWRAVFSEAVRQIAARLIRSPGGDKSRVILVTSAVGGEGKTTLSSQLAATLAEMGQNVVLVDFDLRRPSLDAVFGVDRSPGVSEVLRAEVTLEETIQATHLENLSLIAAGTWSRFGMAVLANGAVGSLFRKLRDKFDFVIVDGSPLLPVADTRFISTAVDGVILSVLRDTSRLPKVTAARKVLDAFNVRLLGAVVTGAAEDVYYDDPRYAATAAEADSQN